MSPSVFYGCPMGLMGSGLFGLSIGYVRLGVDMSSRIDVDEI